MSLEAIERITKLEETLRAEKADAQTQCRAMKEAALRAGEEHLAEVRRAAAQQEKELLAQAEQRAAEKGEEIARTARAQSEELRRQAEANLSKAVELIVERVVRS